MADESPRLPSSPIQPRPDPSGRPLLRPTPNLTTIDSFNPSHHRPSPSSLEFPDLHLPFIFGDTRAPSATSSKSRRREPPFQAAPPLNDGSALDLQLRSAIASPRSQSALLVLKPSAVFASILRGRVEANGHFTVATSPIRTSNTTPVEAYEIIPVA